MTLYDAVADLDLSIEGFDLERREQDTSSGFTRVTTVFSLHGAGETGRGEDVTYDAEDHDALRDADPEFPFAGEQTLGSFSEELDDVDLFPGKEPKRETGRHYRRWAVESAALDLALRQADTDLGTLLGREYDPVRFVVSTRLDEEGGSANTRRVHRWLEMDGATEFKLDPTEGWTDEVVADLAATGRVRVLDLKGQYEGTDVDGAADPALYERVVEGFPDALIEDPKLTDETRAALSGHESRVTWDYPITGVESIEGLPFEPEWLNVKPSRFGTVESLFDSLDYCAQHGIDCYGGGQFELDVGRGQIQLLASLFYPDSPNDVAPGAYNRPEPTEGLPTSPLPPSDEVRGFRWS